MTFLTGRIYHQICSGLPPGSGTQPPTRSCTSTTGGASSSTNTQATCNNTGEDRRQTSAALEPQLTELNGAGVANTNDAKQANFNQLFAENLSDGNIDANDAGALAYLVARHPDEQSTAGIALAEDLLGCEGTAFANAILDYGASDGIVTQAEIRQQRNLIIHALDLLAVFSDDPSLTIGVDNG